MSFTGVKISSFTDTMMCRSSKISNYSLGPILRRPWRRLLSSTANLDATIANSRRILGKPILSLPSLIEKADAIRETITLKNLPESVSHSLDALVLKHPELVETNHRLDALFRNRAEWTTALKQGNKEHVQDLKKLKPQIQSLTKTRDALVEELETSALALPELIHHLVPHGEEFEVVELINCSNEKEAESRKMAGQTQSHRLVGQELGILEMETASRVSGHAFYYFVGDGMLLEQALIQYAIKLARNHRYFPVAAPLMVQADVIGACGFQPRDQGQEKQVYTLEDEPLALTGTAEIPLAALQLKRTFTEQEFGHFPIKYVGLSRAYRAEAGARGRATSGIYRVHEFNKVELFHFTSAERAYQELESIRELQTSFIRSLGFQARVLNMPAGDLGAPAAKKYDIEAWFPGMQRWGELSSALVCGDYQARRLNIRYRDPSSGLLVHVVTLNGTAAAIPRLVAAIIENFYDPEKGGVVIPEVLRPYMGGQEVIRKNDALYIDE